MTILNDVMKTCGRCNESIPQVFFSRNRLGRDGFYSICKKCRAITSKIYRQRPEVRAKARIKCKEFMRGYRKTQKNRKYQMEFSHRAKSKERKAFRARRLYAKDPICRLNKAMSGGIVKALKFRKANLRWERCVGYSLVDLVRHIESKFTPGMTWDNYGKWHIDHKLPKSMFNYNYITDEEFKQCWSLDNLQPLWAIDNLKKGVKL